MSVLFLFVVQSRRGLSQQDNGLSLRARYKQPITMGQPVLTIGQ